MFDISIRSNLREFGIRARDYKNLTSKAIRSAFYDIGKDMVKNAKEYIDESKHGRTYLIRLGRSKFRKSGITPNVLANAKRHIASAAGEAPAQMTGKLKKSIDFKVIGSQKMDFGVLADKWGCDYAKYLEYRDLIKMSGQVSDRIEPRPFISRSYKENRTKMMERIKQEIDKNLK